MNAAKDILNKYLELGGNITMKDLGKLFGITGQAASAAIDRARKNK